MPAVKTNIYAWEIISWKYFIGSLSWGSRQELLAVIRTQIVFLFVKTWKEFTEPRCRSPSDCKDIR